MGSMFGGRSPAPPEVTAPPKLKDVKGVVDKESRKALQRQAQRRGIAATDDRSLLGTQDSERTRASLLANIHKTESDLSVRDERIESDRKEHLFEKKLAELDASTRARLADTDRRLGVGGKGSKSRRYAARRQQSYQKARAQERYDEGLAELERKYGGGV